MKLYNMNRGITVVTNLNMAVSFRDRAVGLLGSHELEDGEGLLILKCKSIHTFFMRFSIDTIFLDKDLKVLEVVEEVKPFRVLIGPIKSKSILEAPVGTIYKTGTRAGDILKMED